MTLSPLAKKRIGLAVIATANLTALSICVLMLYEVIDLFGTAHHWWVGNAATVAILHTVGGWFDGAVVFLAPIVKQAFYSVVATGVGIGAFFGLSKWASEVTMLLVAIVLYIALFGPYAFRVLRKDYYDFRNDIRSWRRKRQTAK